MYPRWIRLPSSHSFFLFGPRLTGKSTLLKQVYAGAGNVMIDLLDTKNFERYTADPSALGRELAAYPKTPRRVILDEVQRVPALLNEVHRLMESAGTKDIQFVMSGSSARKLKRAHADMLAGRAWTFELHPLSTRELGKDLVLEKALAFGTLPKVYSQAGEDARLTLASYVETYLASEIQAEALVRNLGAFLRFLPWAAQERGNMLNFSAISRETGTTYKTVQEYFQILADTLIGSWLPAFAKSARSRLAKHPKFYLFDTGVMRALSKTLTVPVERRTSAFGRLFEHWIVNETRKIGSYGKRDWTLSYYRTESGAEVDMVIERPGKDPIAVEIKATDRPSSADLSGLVSFGELVRGAQLRLVCLINRPQAFKSGTVKISAIPWKDFLAEITP